MSLFEFCADGDIIKSDSILRKNTNLVNSVDENGNTLLIIASMYGNVPFVRYLLSSFYGINISYINQQHMSALNIAHIFGHVEIEQMIDTFLKSNKETDQKNVILRQ